MMRIPALGGKLARRTACAAVVGLTTLLASHVDTASERLCFGVLAVCDIGAADRPIAGLAGEPSTPGSTGWTRLSDYRLPGTKRASKSKKGKGGG